MASHMICPITMDIMRDPVIASDGHTYERSAITRWIQEHGKSPQTNQYMRVRDLVPNRAIRTLIDEHLKNNPGAASSRPSSAVSTVSKSFKVTSVKKEHKPSVCTEELFQSILATTTATVHPNSYNQEQSIVRIECPKLKDAAVSSHICCVIDVSGSMAAEAACKDEQGLETRTGLSILDVVKFATLVISKSLRGRDRLSIVTYSNTAVVVLEPTPMDEEGKLNVEKVLASINPQNMTNLWDGMRTGIRLSNQLGDDYNNSVFVLTDGIPNVHPPLGYERSLKKLLHSSPFNGTLSTFGFGYNLDSPLLCQIARDGGGYFSFIPDAGFVGTCFINAVANARTAFGLNPYLRIKAVQSGMSSSLNTFYRIDHDEDISTSCSLHMTPLRFGASVDILLDNKYFRVAESEMELIFNVVGGQEARIPIKKLVKGDKGLDVFHTLRSNFIKKGLEVTSGPYSSRNVNAFIPSRDAASFRGSNNSVEALCKDLEGQASEAVSCVDYYDRWGRHYLFSLLCAHTHQFCNNFKDPGVQLYGTGELFTSLQEELNDIFETIPAPTPTAPRYWKKRTATKAAPNMSRAFNNRNAVCFHGKTRIVVKKENSNDVDVCSIAEVRKGDSVLTEGGDFAVIECVVETITETPMDLVVLDNLWITPYHPIKVNSSNEWQFPIDCKHSGVECSDSNSVFNLVLKAKYRSEAIITEDGVACITLGHGITCDETLRHAYFGTDLVVKDLQKIRVGWMLGHIILREEDIKREKTSQEIYKIALSNSHTNAVDQSHFLCSAV